ncbi:MAG: PilZ domain-containing protein [Pseudomonadota bacterium]
MTWEQRKTHRLKPQKRVFVSLGSNLSQVGKVLDISPGGLSFEFISDKEAEEGDTHVDIFTLDEGVSLPGLPCSLAYQLSESLPGRKEETDKAFMARKCGVKFHGLQCEQWFQIHNLLESDPAEQPTQDESAAKKAEP